MACQPRFYLYSVEEYEELAAHTTESGEQGVANPEYGEVDDALLSAAEEDVSAFLASDGPWPEETVWDALATWRAQREALRNVKNERQFGHRKFVVDIEEIR